MLRLHGTWIPNALINLAHSQSKSLLGRPEGSATNHLPFGL